MPHGWLASMSSRREELLAKLDDVVEGRWSTWNTFANDFEHGHERAAVCDAQQAVMLAAAASAYPMSETIDVVFDGPPGHESGRFIEVENIDGASVGIGEWIDRGNGMWALRIEVAK